MTSQEIRRTFLGFFTARGHVLRPSSPLVPQGDATLMFTSAGMVPFKPYFLGLRTDLSRATSCQKCFRTTDIDRVGLTLRHLTFFEMLGNFSFGDYFKDEVIPWAWELLTKELGFDPKRLHPTVFKEDKEAAALWEKIVGAGRVVPLGEDQNFWAVGPTGPCGPCSEIYFDRGPEHGCGKTDCRAGCDCDRFLEIWNLVFMQHDRQADGSLKDLPRRNIDTGAGLERLAFALQGKASPFETDLFAPIVEKAAGLLGVEPGRDEASRRAFRVIADHGRAAVMLLAEGVIPSNVDRGYVLRRLIRRALRYGQLLGCRRPFLNELVPAAIGIFREGYPELAEAAAQISGTLKIEEEKFLETLERGELELGKLLAEGSRRLPGEKAFWLYETFGFPLELTREICAQKGVAVEEEGFAKARERAADVARSSWKGSGERQLSEVTAGLSPTRFVGYDRLEAEAAVARSAPGLVVLEQTPFYAEGGGQVGDSGVLIWDGGRREEEVLDTQKQGGVFVHLLRDSSRRLPEGAKVRAVVDAERRERIRPHHTATHLLNEALRRVLGPHVRQAGSYVGPDKLRFDFTHPKALSAEELSRVEAIVNEEIRAAEPVRAREQPISLVKELGATTLLGEDYGAKPRFLLIGAKGWERPLERFSLELCGGTHVSNTGEIAAFKIVKESSASAGVRRIEALAGRAVSEYEQARREERRAAAAQWRAREAELLEQLRALGGSAEAVREQEAEALRAAVKSLENELRSLKAKSLAAAGQKGRQTVSVKGLTLRLQRFEDADSKQLRALCDKAKAELGSGLVFLAASGGGRLSFVLAATPDLASKGVDAARIAKAFAAGRGGSAGGRADFAQGGVSDGDWDGLVAALSAAI